MKVLQFIVFIILTFFLLQFGEVIVNDINKENKVKPAPRIITIF